jgi:hypothetical protein
MHEHHKRRTFVGRQASETMTKAYVKLTSPYLSFKIDVDVSATRAPMPKPPPLI